MSGAGKTAVQLVSMIERALLGQRRRVELATVAFMAGGHLLIEDVPGVGKTTLAKALARATGGEYRRIQFTSDMMPADITGVSVWNAGSGDFVFKPGPIFGNLVLADEINRATPKTQSALLEAMSEGSISVDGAPRELPTPFMVVATQNEQEHHGTYPLPESQLDRFLMRISMGYPEPQAERSIIGRATLMDPVERISPVISPEDAIGLFEAVDRVKVEPSIVEYIMDIVAETRGSEMLVLGVGPRGGMALHRAARAHAVLAGRDYCVPDDVAELVLPVLAHRVVTRGADWEGSGRATAERALNEIMDRVEIPT